MAKHFRTMPASPASVQGQQAAVVKQQKCMAARNEAKAREIHTVAVLAASDMSQDKTPDDTHHASREVMDLSMTDCTIYHITFAHN